MTPFRKKRCKIFAADLHEMDPAKKTSYINLTILDASEAVYQMTHEKIVASQKGKPGPAFVKKKVANFVAKTASSNVSPSMIAKKLSLKLPKKLMYKMHHKMGLQLAAQVVFREENYVVIRIQVQKANVKLLLDKARNPDNEEDDDDDSVATAVVEQWIEEQNAILKEQKESPFVTEASPIPIQDNTAPVLIQNDAKQEMVFISAWKEMLFKIFEWILTKLLPVTVSRNLEDNHLPKMIQAQVTKNMKSMLDEKLNGMSLKAETEVLTEDKQAGYFFTHLQKVRKSSVGKEEVGKEE